MDDSSLTPMIKQYLAIKEKYSDSILFYRIGDFYEMFFEDAVQASKLLDITLTSRNKNDPNPIPLCGVPHHSVEPYIAKLLQKGKKVAVCDQVEDPKIAKGVVRREVTRVITPGIILDSASVKGDEHNYIAAIAPNDSTEGAFGLAIADVSTGHFSALQFNSMDALSEEVFRLEPKEIILPISLSEKTTFNNKIKKSNFNPVFTVLNNNFFEPQAISGLDGARTLIKQYPMAAKAAAAIWSYIADTQKGEARHISRIETSVHRKTMRIDESTKRNLELFKTIIDGGSRGSLISVLDRTSTSFGARKLRDWLVYPLMNVDSINSRLNAVETIIQKELVRDLPLLLEGVYDIERIGARIAMGTASTRDLIALADSCEMLPKIINIISQSFQIKGIVSDEDKDFSQINCQEKATSGNLIKDLCKQIDPLHDIVQEIRTAIIDDPPMSLREGGFIREGVNSDLDELRSISGGGKNSIAGIEARERARSGISSLKVKYNKVFGYYIEITNTHKDKIPSDYIRKQTLVNAERYITEELKEYEDKVLSAEDKIKTLEYEIFCGLREKIAAFSGRISMTADALAVLDVLTSFALLSRENKYCKPVVNNELVIKITDGRHPIVEKLNPTERFVPNDIYLDCNEQYFLVITGPNMAGKSTVMRQVALIVLMAQIGCFVPARQATLGVVDRIFTRIGATDALSQGQSTFMVEMSEAASILKEATQRSLIIIDEIGRGTSTFDGLSIAWAIAEDIHNRIGARTLFATHYHELTELALTRKGIKNFNIAVKEWNGEIIFLRRLVPGGTSRSYGIQVAKLAGLPIDVIERSKEVLKNLEAGEFDEIGEPRIASHGGVESLDKKNQVQMDLFSSSTRHEVIEKISSIDTSTITPIEAINLLHELKQKI